MGWRRKMSDGVVRWLELCTWVVVVGWIEWRGPGVGGCVDAGGRGV